MSNNTGEVSPIVPLWTSGDLAAFLVIPEKTLREWRCKGYGPAWRKVGKHVRYDPADVRAWLDASVPEPRSGAA